MRKVNIYIKLRADYYRRFFFNERKPTKKKKHFFHVRKVQTLPHAHSCQVNFASPMTRFERLLRTINRRRPIFTYALELDNVH